MADVKLEDIEIFGKEINFYSVTGKVIDTNRTTTTNTTASGGGGYFDGHRTQVNDVVINSKSTINDTIWLQFVIGDTDEVVEQDITVKDFPVRNNQKISMVYAGHEEEKTSEFIALYNHSTGSIHKKNGVEMLVNDNITAPSRTNLYISNTVCTLLGVGLGASVLGLPTAIIGGILGFFVGGIIGLRFVNNEDDEAKQKLDMHLDNAAF